MVLITAICRGTVTVVNFQGESIAKFEAKTSTGADVRPLVQKFCKEALHFYGGTAQTTTGADVQPPVQTFC